MVIMLKYGGFMKKGFDNELYVKLQIETIKERIKTYYSFEAPENSFISSIPRSV